MKTWWIFAVGAAVLCGCPTPVVCDPEVDDCSDGGGPPPDVCNSRAEALSNAACELTLTTPANADGGTATRLGFIGVGADGGVDQDWYLVKLPALTARSLIHVVAGYGAPQTPVNLAVSVLKENGVSGLARKIDHHGTGGPRPVDIVFPYAESNTQLLIVLSDEGASAKPNIDQRNQYALKVEVIDNPDPNEPNDATATDIPLTAGGPGLVGVGQGALATDDDVDKFSFTAPAGRQILYLHITGACLTPGAAVCNTRLFPEPPFRLAYTLFDAAGKPVAEGQAQNEFIPIDLATARLTTAQTYTLSIYGYKPPNVTTVTPGDLRVLYRVDVQFMDDLDLNEPNDTIAQPKIVPMGYGSCSSFSGRLAYVPDPDIFALDLAATGNAGVLRYSLTVSPTAGRFAPLALASDRQVRVVTQITAGATVGDRRLACKNNTPLCPKGYEGSQQAQSLVEGLCDTQDPPWCTWAERNEDSRFGNLKNMVGAIPVVAHGAVSRYFFFVQDEGNNYADDRVYTINFCYEADPDDTTRAALTNQTQGQVALVENASFPVPVATSEVRGVLSHGYGRVIDNQIDRGEGIRAANDYDAVPTDYDRFELGLPAASIPLDRTWALQWEIDNDDAGVAPGALALEVGFCTGPTTPDAGCTSVDRILAYSGGRIQPWYGADLTSRQVLWKKEKTATSTVITAEPIGCFCLEPRVMSSGHFVFKVGAVDRISNAPISYKVRESLAPYPPSYMIDGGTTSCPVVLDGGASCRFTNNP